ncbi:CHAT domain-containing tetratricopeptide repeat protein [Saccharothrix longispora]|uniref:Tetratricopeptide (TPR) repeat protein n=1 Tax=Saccharothrix longispora TaxID=33920 RepID=A0ABU1PYB1_9PSEU|nr:CHAT domain-containing tetratricopeptide repeat protein [Saccharothrix longispora]MDR6595639.1 tetratricopeptide (TPR) repeat protein [Saccharothrix longispora]
MAAESAAAAALDARQRDPRAAIEMGRSALRAARLSGDAEEASTAERAIGLSLRELHDFDGALRHLRRSVRIAEGVGSARLAALARVSLAFVLSTTGRHAQALRAVNEALGALDGGDADIARMQRGLVLHYLCRYDEAQREYNSAIEAARRTGDRLGEARARNNRGLLRAYTGGLKAADEDFDRAAALYRSLGQELAVADVRWNAGISASRAGDVPRALTMFAEAEREYRRLAVPRPALLINRLELLVSVPLLEEARAAADRALEEMVGDLVLARSEAQFYRARIALLEGDLERAVEMAVSARRGFRRERREVWEASARHVELRAAYLSGQRTRGLVTALVRVASRLEAFGWRMAGLEARVDAALVARDLGDRRRAVAELTTAGAARRGGTAAHRVQGWYAEALRRDLLGNARGAQIALRRGLGLLDEYRVSLGAVELRASSGAQGKALAFEGLRTAVAGGHAGRVLSWAEAWRAGAMRMTPARPPEDSGLADALAELRAVSADLEIALLAGKPSAGLRQRQVRGEQRVRDLTRQTSGGGAVFKPPAVRDLAQALGERALVEYVDYDGDLLAVVVAGGRASLHRLGPLDGALREVRLLRFALHRLVTLPGHLDRTAVRGGADHTARLLDTRLLAPLRRRLDDRPLVLAPTGQLGGLPWSALPGCRGRSVTVVPSATVWLRAALSSVVPHDRAVLAAGPRLPAAPTEIAAIAPLAGGASVLVGADATVDAVAAAMDGAPLAHVAAHGSFRADNPLFSALELADGPLTVHDLERLRRPPALVVLSACDSGLSAVRPGDELMGFTAALLGLGTRTLVAPVVPVPAEVTTPLMVDLHRRLGKGDPPAVALARAQEAHRDTGHEAYAASAGFLCFGA